MLTFVSGKQLIFTYAKGSKFPISYERIGTSNVQGGFLAPTSSGRLNVPKAQEKLLLWHSILGHYDIRNTYRLVSKGTIRMKFPRLCTCNIPMCRACVVEKAKRVGFESATHTPNKSHIDFLKKDDLKPGDQVSTSQYEYRVKGRLPYPKGKRTLAKLCVGAHYLLTIHLAT